MNVKLSPNQSAMLAQIKAQGFVFLYASNIASANALVKKGLVRIDYQRFDYQVRQVAVLAQ